MKTIFYSFRATFRYAPFSTCVTAITYLIQGLFPAVFLRIFTTILEKVGKGEAFEGEIRALAVFFTLQTAATILNNVTLNAGVFEKTDFQLRKELALCHATLPPIFFEDSASRDRAHDAKNAIEEESVGMVVLSSLQFAKAVVTTGTLTVLLGGYHPLLLPIALSGIGTALVIRAVRGAAFKKLRESRITEKRFANYLFELLSTQSSNRELRVLRADGYLFKKWETAARSVCKKDLHFQEKDADASFLSGCIRGTMYLCAFLFLLVIGQRGMIGAAVVSGALTALKSLQDSGENMLVWLQSLIRNAAAAQSYFQFTNVGNMRVKARVNPGRIELKNVSFTYPHAKSPALANVNLVLEQGETIAVVGKNGCGKTTLSKILTGAYAPSSGEIRMGGEQIPGNSDLVEKDLFSVMPQAISQYHLLLGEAVTFMDGWEGRSREIQELLDCLAFDFQSFGGLGVQLGREFGGVQLSGGQWQALTAARCALRRAPIVVLDEPTSAIDPFEEDRILKVLLNAAKKASCLIITHHMSLCQSVDRILLLEDGKKVGFGTHRELMEKCGLYRSMYEAQSLKYRDS